MEHALAKIDPALMALMHGSFGKDGALQPFARETMLMECQIAGIAHRNVKKVEPRLAIGTMLTLKRQPDNAYDRFAIMILTEAGDHLGYVPRAKNETLARLMDAGKLLFAKLESKSW
ncbi:MAG: HIRAN domain-containing protein, partial [Verrucomicrobiota bacterium]